MGDSLRWRVLATVTLLCLLGGLIVWLGSVEPDPANNDYPGDDEVAENPETYVDERISMGGVVVETEPLTIENEAGTFVVDGVDRTVADGDELVVYGILRPDGRIEAIETIHTEPWEIQYMYLVSFLGGMWVLGRLLNRWTIDTTQWAIVPRSEPLLSSG